MPRTSAHIQDVRRVARPGHPNPSVDTHPFLSIIQPGIKRPRLSPGERVARFEIKEHLGSGSLAEVYLAHDRDRQEDVAIKAVDIGPLGSEIAAALLRSEATAHSRIQDCRHVLKVHDVHQVNRGGTELLLLSTEYADGGSMRKWLQDHALNVEVRRTQGAEFFLQMCLGVKAIHDAGIAHLDIKPDNALFVHGVLKIADFSVSAVVRPLTLHCAPDPDATSTRGCVGTPTYMSPEQFFASTPSDLDWRSDIYSLGVTAFEIHHPKGRPPFSGNYAQLREQHAKAPVPLLPDADEAMRRVVQRCLQKDPAKRYQDVGDLIDDLKGGQQVQPDAGCPDEADAMWSSICQYLGEGRLNDVRRACTQLLAKAPGHADAKALQDELQDRYEQARQLYTAMERSMDGLGLEDALGMLYEAVDVFPDFPTGRVVQVKLSIRARQYREAMDTGIALASQRNWEAAAANFERAAQLNPGSQAAQNPLRIATAVVGQVREQRSRIDEQVTAGNKAGAMSLARSLDEYLDDMDRHLLAITRRIPEDSYELGQ